MKKNEMDRLLWLLAATGWSDSTIAAMVEELRVWGPRRVLNELRRVRAARPSRLSALEEHEDYRAAVDRAAELLRSIEDVSVADAAREILVSIKKSNPSVEIPPFRPKEGLKSWLATVERKVGSSELLHRATQARNRLTNQPARPWALK